jgi:uncharacterized protein (DUF2141 family)
MNSRKRFGTAGLLVAIGLTLAGAVSAQVRPDRTAPDVRPDVVAPPRPPGPAAPGKDVAPIRGGQVCVVAYDDRNANGRRDGGEGPLLGQSFTIANATGATLAQGATGPDGRFCTPRPLPFGDYRVRQVLGGGWTNTDPGQASPNVKSVSVRTDSPVAVLFGSCRGPGCKDGGAVRDQPGAGGPAAKRSCSFNNFAVLKYKDINGNFIRESGIGEVLLSGWTFEIRDTSGVLVATYVSGGPHICLPPGSYTASEIPQPGWESTAPGGVTQLPFTITNPGTWYNLMFGNRQLPQGQACVSKFEDIDGDGQKDAIEPFLAGWTFTLSNGVSGVTGANGRFCWTAPVGAYTVTETMKPGWMSTDPGGAAPTKPVPVVVGQSLVMFGNRKLGRVCVTKYNDLNGDGARQSAEPGLTGWTFHVKDANGATVATLTSTSGYPACSASILPPGSYTITEVLPATGWKNTDPGGAAVESFTVASGGTFNAVFGNVQLGKICVRKYNDVNGNGSWAAPEPFMSGVPFQVTDSNGHVVSAGVTAALGLYCTPNTLLPGVYTVTETVPVGWTNTQPGIPSATVTLASPLGVTVWFGNRKDPLPGELCVLKYNDANGNGVRDGGEGPLPGWTFTRSGGGMPTLSGATGANGRWCAGTLLPPGSYTVAETMKPGWSSTDPGGSTPVKTAVITPNGTTTVEFGNRQNPLPGELCVLKYNDTNGNGVRDGGEGPLPGWTFTRGGGGMPTLSGATGANGRWCAGTLLPPGSYTVTETMKPGWTSTDPGGSTPAKTAVITPNGTTTVEFGNQVVGPNLTLVKTKLTAGYCHGWQPGANNCNFRFTITNSGGSTYTGPLSISDTVTLGGGALPVSVVTPPPGWSCSAGTQTPIVCSIGSVSIAAGATVTYDLQLLLNAPAPSQKNCAVLTWGNQQTGPACVQIFP